MKKLIKAGAFSAVVAIGYIGFKGLVDRENTSTPQPQETLRKRSEKLAEPSIHSQNDKTKWKRYVPEGKSYEETPTSHSNYVEDLSAQIQNPSAEKVVYRKDVVAGQYPAYHDSLWTILEISQHDLEAFGLSSHPMIYRDAVNSHLYHLPIHEYKMVGPELQLDFQEADTKKVELVLRPVVDSRVQDLIRNLDPKAKFRVILPKKMMAASSISQGLYEFTRSRDDSQFYRGTITLSKKSFDFYNRYAETFDKSFDLNLTYELDVTSKFKVKQEAFVVEDMKLPASAMIKYL